MKIPVTPSGMDTVTIRVVAQCLNQLRFGDRYIKRTAIAEKAATFCSWYMFNCKLLLDFIIIIIIIMFKRGLGVLPVS
jgi:hypothetical protein